MSAGLPADNVTERHSLTRRVAVVHAGRPKSLLQGDENEMTESDVAVLVLAHRDPHSVARLTQSLTCDWIDTFIHIDGAAAISPFQRACTAVNAEFLPDDERKPVNWGGWSQLSAILRLMRYANARRPYRRYVLLSGADLLIKPLPVLREQMLTDIEFLRIDRALTSTAPQIGRYHFRDAPPMLQRLNGRIPRRPPTTDPMHQGSTWWALTGDAVAHTLRFLDEDPTWLRFHRYTSCPDEIVIHTTLKTSPFADRISDDRTRTASDDHPDVHGLHHIIWPDDDAYSPRDLTGSDIDALRDSPACFARKIGQDSDDVVRAFTAGPIP